MSAPSGKNPYRPGAATPPLHLAGREPQLNRLPRILAAAPEIPANVRLTGLRGVGKSVLLKEYEAIAEAQGWATVRVQVEPRHNTEAGLVQLVTSLIDAKKARLSLARRIGASVADAVDAGRQLLSVSYADLTISLAGSLDGAQDLAKALYDMAEAAVATRHTGFALMLDEAQVIRDDNDRQGEHPLSLLVAAVNVLQEAGLPISLILCGLPTLGPNLQKARTYSERMFRAEEIGPLAGNPGPARDAFVLPLRDTGVVADEQLISRVVEEVEGYPFFIQLWGAELWDAAVAADSSQFTTDLLDAIETEIYARLDREFYAGRVETLTPSEQDLLIATGRCPYPPLRTSEIRGHSSKTDGNINVLMGRLVEQGAVYRIQKGVYAYTAPKFHEYLNRRISRTNASN